MAVRIVAHRGESLIAPENTLESFTLAWARGAVCIEGDFHLSKDGEIICMHDDNPLRTCGVDRPVSAMTASGKTKSGNTPGSRRSARCSKPCRNTAKSISN